MRTTQTKISLRHSYALRLLPLLLAAACDDEGKSLYVGSDLVNDASYAEDAYTLEDASISQGTEAGGTLSVAIQRVGCSEGCVLLKAEAKGGLPPYSFVWDDGSTADTRSVCNPTATTTYQLTVSDTEALSAELGHASEQAQASVSGSALSCSSTSQDAGIYWAEWNRLNGPEAGVEGMNVGSIPLPSAPITTFYEGDRIEKTPDTNDYWVPEQAFLSATVDHKPRTQPIRLLGSSQALASYRVKLSRPVLNPLFAFTGLGGGQLRTESKIVMAAPFSVLSSTPGLKVNAQAISGIDAAGVIQLEGTFETIEWQCGTPEPSLFPLDEPGWYGITVGVRAP